MRFCYFSENILSLNSYYQLSYASIWLTGILLTIANILIKSWNVHFHFALDWSNVVWPIWWLRQSIKLCKRNESVVVITNTRCVSLWGKLVLQFGKALFYYKLGQTLLHIWVASLLQIRANVVTNWGSYYKLQQQLSQNRATITNWSKIYYKLWQLLQIGT